MRDPARRAALDALTAAFPPTPLQDRRAFAEWGYTYLGASTFEEAVRGRRWTDLPAQLLEQHHDALPFFGPSSIGEYLPAYLAALLAGDPVLDGLPEFLLGLLTRTDPARFDARFAQLSAPQRAAVRAALVALDAAWAASPRRAIVRAALASYWERVGAPER